MIDEIDESERFSLQFGEGYDEADADRHEPNQGSAVVGYDPNKDRRRQQQSDPQAV